MQKQTNIWQYFFILGRKKQHKMEPIFEQLHTLADSVNTHATGGGIKIVGRLGGLIYETAFQEYSRLNQLPKQTSDNKETIESLEDWMRDYSGTGEIYLELLERAHQNS